MLQNIISEKLKGFVGRQKYVEYLWNFANSQDDHNYLVVHAIAGSGKSALLAKFLQKWDNKFPTIAHYMSMGENSREVSGAIQSLAENLHDLGLIKNLERDFNSQYKQLRKFLKNTDKNLVIVLDGLDEIEEGGKDLAWLPDALPSNVRLILSTRGVETREILKGYSKIQELELPPLLEEEIQEIILQHNQEYSISLSVNDTALLSKRAAGNPLYLKVALDEIRSQGIAVGQLAVSIESLFSQIVERLQNRHGKQNIDDYLGIIAASRSGVTEQELWELLSQNTLTDDFILTMNHALDSFVVLRLGMINFFHPEFERSMKMQLGKRGMREYHQKLATYFQSKGYGYFRTLQELPYQLQWAELYQELLQQLVDIKFLQTKCENGLGYGILEDFQRLLRESAVKLPENIEATVGDKVTVNHQTMVLLKRVWELELQFLMRHPQCVFQNLWNRCYWHDCPETSQHYHNFSPAKTQIYKLAEHWREIIPENTIWIESKRPLEPHLHSPLLLSLRGHDGWVRDVAVSPDGQYIASGSSDKTVIIWDIHTGELLQTLQHPDWVTGIAYHEDGKRLVTGCRDGKVRIWSVAKAECLHVLEGHQAIVQDVDVHKNTIISGSKDHSICFWDIDTTKCLQKTSVKTAIRCVAISEKWAIVGTKSGAVYFWNREKRSFARETQGHQGETRSVALDPLQKYAVSSSVDSTIKLWDLEGFQCVNTISNPPGDIRNVSFDPYGKKIVSASTDRTIKIWDVATGELLNTLLGHEGDIRSALYTPDGKIISGALDRTIRVWHEKVGKFSGRLIGHSDYVRSVVANHSENLVASCSRDQTIHIWDTNTGMCRHTLTGHRDNITQILFSVDDNLLISGAHDNTVRLWNVATGECAHVFDGHSDYIRSLILCGTNRVISGGRDKTIRIWDIPNKTCDAVLSGHAGYVQALCCNSSTNLLASGCREKEIKVWDLIQKQQILSLPCSHDAGVTAIVFHPDDSIIASASDDGTIKTWKTQTGELLNTFRGHKSYVIDLAFTNNGQHIVSFGWDRTMRVWETQTGQCLSIKDGYADLEGFTKNFPIYALNCGLEMVVFTQNDKPIAFFPEAINHLKPFASYFLCGGIGTGYVHILKVNGLAV